MIKKFIAVVCTLSLVFTQVNFLNVSAASDKLAPVFKSSVPKNNQIGTERNARIKVSFSENIFKGKYFLNIKVTNLTNKKKISISRSISKNLLVISHSYFFGYDTLYSVTIPAKAVKDKAGNLLKKAVTIKFRTKMKPFSWPVPGYYSISSPFGMKYNPLTGLGKMHTGIDIPAPSGTSVIAANSGEVSDAGWDNAYGNYIVIEHDGGNATFYGHLNSILVSVDELVYKGKPIGTVGSTGYSVGSHLHFGVIKEGLNVDPASYV